MSELEVIRTGRRRIVVIDKFGARRQIAWAPRALDPRRPEARAI